MMNGLTPRRMVPADRPLVAALLAEFVRGDDIADHADAYGGSGDDLAIARALTLFERRPELGFIWVTLDASNLVALATVCFAISTNRGSVVARISDFVVTADARQSGVGRSTMASLAAELRTLGIERIDLGVHNTNAAAQTFYAKFGFAPNHELGMSLVLES